MNTTRPKARISMPIGATAAAVYRSFIEPEWLTRFWLASATGPLRVGSTVEWHFLVPGATVQTTATLLDADRRIEWRWSDGSTVTIELAPFEAGTAVTLCNENFAGTADEQLAAALNATEGFTIVVSDLKTLLESGASAGLTRAKARLIEARKA